VFNVNGQTRSKFYSSRQFIDDQVHGVTGSGIGAWMIIPGTGYEGASGGPFFRDINNQGGGDQELYYCERLHINLVITLDANFYTFRHEFRSHPDGELPTGSAWSLVSGFLLAGICI
jgi:hypothetical protein